MTRFAPPVQSLGDEIRSLQTRSIRDQHQRFWIEGIRNFVRACDAGLAIERIAYSRVLLKSNLAEKLCRRAKARGSPRVSLTPEEFRSISRAPRPSGIGAIVRQPWRELDALAGVAGRFFLVMECIRDPGNLGTILRTAEAAGAAAAIFVGDACDPFAPQTLRASMGGIFGATLVRTTHERLAAWLDRNDIALIGLSPRGERGWCDMPHDRAVALALGEERSGLSEYMRMLCRESVRLPIVGRADSLNVAVAAGIAMYEFVRRGELSCSAPARGGYAQSS